MLVALQIVLVIVLLGVVSVLGMGFYSLYRGGEFGQRWSNKLMRLRVLLQFTAILVLGAMFLLSRHTS